MTITLDPASMAVGALGCGGVQGLLLLVVAVVMVLRRRPPEPPRVVR